MRVARPALWFVASASMLVAACVAVVRSQLFANNPDVAAWGVTFDLTITLPLLYWFFVVRTGRAGPLTVVPVFLAGTILASRLIPSGGGPFLQQLGTMAVPAAELLLVVALVQRVRRARREAPAVTDPFERISTAVDALAGKGRIADVVASEMTMLYYALFSWRKEPEPRHGALTFHHRNGWGTIVACIFVLISAEGIAMHLFLTRWHPLAGWAWTALDLWAVLWLLGDYHALRLRRSWVDPEAFHLHYGLRWNVTIPRELIASIEEIRSESEWKRKDVLKVAILEDPRWLILLREPLPVRGMAGLRKTVRAIAILPDDDQWMASFT